MNSFSLIPSLLILLIPQTMPILPTFVIQNVSTKMLWISNNGKILFKLDNSLLHLNQQPTIILTTAWPSLGLSSINYKFIHGLLTFMTKPHWHFPFGWPYLVVLPLFYLMKPRMHGTVGSQIPLLMIVIQKKFIFSEPLTLFGFFTGNADTKAIFLTLFPC